MADTTLFRFTAGDAEIRIEYEDPWMLLPLSKLKEVSGMTMYPGTAGSDTEKNVLDANAGLVGRPVSELAECTAIRNVVVAEATRETARISRVST